MNDIAAAPSMKRIRRALRRSGGNLLQAATDLKMSRRELRAMVDADLELLTQALEARERALDRAEVVLRQAMRTGEARQKMAAAGRIARGSPRWRNEPAKLRQPGE